MTRKERRIVVFTKCGLKQAERACVKRVGMYVEAKNRDDTERVFVW